MVVDKARVEHNIIALLGIEALPIDQKTALLDKMVDLIERRVVAQILHMLPKEVGDQFAEAVQADKMNDVERIMLKYVPDLPKLMDDEVERLKAEMVGVVNNLPQ